jgi:dephospho-CoA kinase
MLNLIKIAVTGGVASGKSTVCQLFQKLGAYSVSADAITHKLFDPLTDLGQQIIYKLGSDILQNGKINRKIVADKVFKDQKLLLELEQILHPAVLKQIEQEYATVCKAGLYRAFVVEIPLLFEIEAESFYDVTINVNAEPEKAVERFTSLGFNEEDYNRRMSRQLSTTTKSAKAQFTINNNGTLEDLKCKVLELSERIFIHES